MASKLGHCRPAGAEGRSDVANEYSDAANEYSDTANEYSVAANEYSDAADEYSDMADEYSDAANEYSDAANEYSDAADEYSDTADEYSDTADEYSFSDLSRHFTAKTAHFSPQTTNNNTTPMAKSLFWSSPSFVWNKKGVVWNGMEPDQKTMKKTKAIINFTIYGDAELAPTAQTIHDKMITNVATFVVAPLTLAVLQALLAALQTLINTYAQALAKKASRASDDILAFNVARHDLEGALSDLGGTVNHVAQGDPVIVGLSGFPSYGGASALPNATRQAPDNLRLAHGDLSTTVKAHYHPDGQHTMNEVQTTTGDPNNEAGWVTAGFFGGGKALLTGLTVGTTLWVRVRTRLSNNTFSPWSDPAKITVI